MTKFFIKWWVDTAKIPDTPQEGAKRRLMLLEMVKADLSAGKMTEWGTFSNARDGYAIIDGSEEDVIATMFKWIPALEFEVFPVLSVDQSINVAKKAAAEMQA